MHCLIAHQVVAACTCMYHEQQIQSVEGQHWQARMNNTAQGIPPGSRLAPYRLLSKCAACLVCDGLLSVTFVIAERICQSCDLKESYAPETQFGWKRHTLTSNPAA